MQNKNRPMLMPARSTRASRPTATTAALVQRRRYRRRGQDTEPHVVSDGEGHSEAPGVDGIRRIPRTLHEQRHLACPSLLVIRQYEPAAVVSYSTLDVATAGRPCIWHAHETALPEVHAYLRCLAQGVAPGSDLLEAWNGFFERYRPAVQLAIRKFGIPRHDTGDCAQVVWMKIVAQMSALKYQPARGPFSAWLDKLIRNAVIDFLRGSPRTGATTLESLGNRLATVPGPAAVCEGSETRQFLWHLLDHLQKSTSTVNYQVLELLHLDSLSVSEVADRLALSPEQVWYRNHRTLRKLKGLLRAHLAAAD